MCCEPPVLPKYTLKDFVSVRYKTVIGGEAEFVAANTETAVSVGVTFAVYLMFYPY